MPGTVGKLEIVGPAEFTVEDSIPGLVNMVGMSGPDIFNASLFKFTAEDGTEYVIDQRMALQSIADTNNNFVTVSASGIAHSNGSTRTINLYTEIPPCESCGGVGGLTNRFRKAHFWVKLNVSSARDIGSVRTGLKESPEDLKNRFVFCFPRSVS
jgi:hypothetical protein